MGKKIKGEQLDATMAEMDNDGDGKVRKLAGIPGVCEARFYCHVPCRVPKL